MKTPKEVLKSFRKNLDPAKLLAQLKGYVNQIGVQATYAVLLLYYAYRRPETPSWARRMVLGTLAYVLAPIDAIPDLSPFFGFSDDIGVLMFGLVSIAGHINKDVKADARVKLEQWFGTVSAEDLDEVEKKIG
ncbi:MAG: DUF1232 domain-containing protein [Saprospiraceae bacterium]|nr:DUF1232 domain-containing protein [Saprospiraceae bacterium]